MLFTNPYFSVDVNFSLLTVIQGKGKASLVNGGLKGRGLTQYSRTVTPADLEVGSL